MKKMVYFDKCFRINLHNARIRKRIKYNFIYSLCNFLLQCVLTMISDDIMKLSSYCLLSTVERLKDRTVHWRNFENFSRYVLLIRCFFGSFIKNAFLI